MSLIPLIDLGVVYSTLGPIVSITYNDDCYLEMNVCARIQFKVRLLSHTPEVLEAHWLNFIT